MNGFLLTSHNQPGKGRVLVPTGQKRKPRPREGGQSSQGHGHTAVTTARLVAGKQRDLPGHETLGSSTVAVWPCVGSSPTSELPVRTVALGGTWLLGVAGVVHGEQVVPVAFPSPEGSVGSLVPACHRHPPRRPLLSEPRGDLGPGVLRPTCWLRHHGRLRVTEFISTLTFHF